MLADKVKELEYENNSLKAQLEELQERYSDRANLPKNCEYCLNFNRYYAKYGLNYFPVSSGHCIAGNRVRIRDRKDGETCKYFAERK